MLLATRLARPITRRFFSTQAKPNLIQQMPEYQAALQFAVDHKYQDSLGKLEDTVVAVEKQVGPNTKFHLFLYQRMASLHMLLHDLGGVEEKFKRSVEVAESTPVSLNPGMDQTASVFMWQNNLLKFYLEHDVNKAIEYAKDLLDEHGAILSS